MEHGRGFFQLWKMIVNPVKILFMFITIAGDIGFKFLEGAPWAEVTWKVRKFYTKFVISVIYDCFLDLDVDIGY